MPYSLLAVLTSPLHFCQYLGQFSPTHRPWAAHLPMTWNCGQRWRLPRSETCSRQTAHGTSPCLQHEYSSNKASISWIIRKIRETEIPNSSRILAFTIYLADFVYWVGFVTGIAFTTHLWIVDFIIFLVFLKKQPSSLGCYFWETSPFFRTCHFSLFCGRSRIPECVFWP